VNFPGYRASASDGTLTIFDVPIFVECKRGDAAFDAAWLEAAVARAKEAERDGYLPPLHVNHHKPGDAGSSVRAAGFFRVTGVRPIMMKGERVLAVFADLVVTDPSVTVDVMQKRLPYRSVEIFDVAKPGIDGLALLDHEAPYLELPMLMVTDVDDPQARVVASATFAQPWPVAGSAPTREPVACFRRGPTAHLLFQDMEPNPKPTADETGTEGEGTERELDLDGVIAAIEDGSISMADMDRLIAAIQQQRQDRSTNATSSAPAPAAAPESNPNIAMSKNDDKPAVPAADPAKVAPATPAPVAPATMDKGDADARFAAMAGEIIALKGQLGARDAADKRRDDVALAMKRLAGRPLGADLEKELVAFHEGHGPAAFALHVETIAKMSPAIPASHSAAALAFAAQADSTPDVAQPYLELGADAVAKAARLAREWEENSERGYTRMSQERYVQINMARDGLALKAKKPAAVSAN
jgi:hypothetical protein